jgi:hypothetical protein
VHLLTPEKRAALAAIVADRPDAGNPNAQCLVDAMADSYAKMFAHAAAMDEREKVLLAFVRYIARAPNVATMGQHARTVLDRLGVAVTP